MFDYIEAFSHRQRCHSSIDDISPIEFAPPLTNQTA